MNPQATISAERRRRTRRHRFGRPNCFPMSRSDMSTNRSCYIRCNGQFDRKRDNSLQRSLSDGPVMVLYI